VAADTLIPDPVETQGCLRFMALCTGHGRVHPQQREPVLLVKLRYIVNQPIIVTMATGTVLPYRHLVHVSVAGNAFCMRFRKNEAGVARTAVNRSVLACQSEPRPIVVKKGRVHWQWHPRCFRKFLMVKFYPIPMLSGDFPAIRGVAGGAIHVEIVAVRVLRVHGRRKP